MPKRITYYECIYCGDVNESLAITKRHEEEWCGLNPALKFCKTCVHGNHNRCDKDIQRGWNSDCMFWEDDTPKRGARRDVMAQRKNETGKEHAERIKDVKYSKDGVPYFEVEGDYFDKCKKS